MITFVLHHNQYLVQPHQTNKFFFKTGEFSKTSSKDRFFELDFQIKPTGADARYAIDANTRLLF